MSLVKTVSKLFKELTFEKVKFPLDENGFNIFITLVLKASG